MKILKRLSIAVSIVGGLVTIVVISAFAIISMSPNPVCADPTIILDYGIVMTCITLTGVATTYALRNTCED